MISKIRRSSVSYLAIGNDNAVPDTGQVTCSMMYNNRIRHASQDFASQNLIFIRLSRKNSEHTAPDQSQPSQITRTQQETSKQPHISHTTICIMNTPHFTDKIDTSHTWSQARNFVIDPPSSPTTKAANMAKARAEAEKVNAERPAREAAMREQQTAGKSTWSSYESGDKKPEEVKKGKGSIFKRVSLILGITLSECVKLRLVDCAHG